MGPVDQIVPTTVAGLLDGAARPEVVRPDAPGQDPLEAACTLLVARHPEADLELVRRAYVAAEEAHRGQRRVSGDPFITHPVAVATIVAELGLDAQAVASGLLHDAVEDGGISLEQVSAGFGPVVAAIVDGVTKLDRLAFDSEEAQQAATVRKMLLAMAKDWRVLVIKLADRLHNMRTLEPLPDAKRRRIARQTLDIYAPLAHRLGMQEIRWQLEDLAFATLHPKRYGEIEQMVAMRAPQRDSYLQLVLERAGACLEELGIEAEVTGRPKHYWSIYEKMVVRGKEFDEIHDLVGIRVLVDSEKDCWAALGAIHGLWSPVQGRFKDYINTPKFNLYQSLHTTVVGEQGKTLEVQIRTRDMHRRAEYGIAAHWGYKEKSSPAEMAWLQRIVDWQSDTPDPVEFLETLKLDLELDEVYVFTPKGKVITLPVNATPVDFAYAVHTEVGHRCVGAKVNGRLVPIGSKLRSGDTVEIITSKVTSAGPSRDWLSQVASPRARTKIRQWFSRERREDAIDAGREELIKALRREGLPVQKLGSSSTLSSVAEALSYADVDALHAAIGEGHLSARSVAQRLAREVRGDEEEAEQEQVPTTARTPSRPNERRSPGVYVEGLDDLAVWLSRCCTPVPGDEIVGFVTRGRGVSVHRADCANALSLSEGTRERMIEVEWDRGSTGVFRAGIEVRALDRSRLLADVSRVLSEHHINITKSTTRTSSDRVCRMRFEFELANPRHLESVLGALRGLDSVYNAYRLVPGKGAVG